MRRFICAEDRAKYLEDSESIVRAKVGKSNCLRGKERMVLPFSAPAACTNLIFV